MAEIATSVHVEKSPNEEDYNQSNVTNTNALIKNECVIRDDDVGVENLNVCDKKLDYNIESTIILYDDDDIDFCNEKSDNVLDINLGLNDLNKQHEACSLKTEYVNPNTIEQDKTSILNDELPVCDIENDLQAKEILLENTASNVDKTLLFTKSVDEVLKIYSEHEVLTTSDVECSDGAKDLMQRLLNPDPFKRLRSLLSLQNIRFFKDLNFSDIRTKRISPNDVLMKLFPNGPLFVINEECVVGETLFSDFDTDFV